MTRTQSRRGCRNRGDGGGRRCGRAHRLPARASGRRGTRGRHLAGPPGLRAGRDPEQRPRLAVHREEDAGGAADRPRPPLGHRRAGRDAPDDERGRRDFDPLLGAELAAEPLGFPCRERDEAEIRGGPDPRRIDHRGLAARLRRARAPLRCRGAGNRRVGPGRERPRADRSARQPVRGTARAGVSHAAAPLDGLPRAYGGGGADARVDALPGTRSDNDRVVRGPARLRLPRTLQQGRVPRRREERDLRDDDPQGAPDGQPQPWSPGPMSRGWRSTEREGRPAYAM